MLGELLGDLPEAEREELERVAREMLQRHREMFPADHTGREDAT